MERLNVAISILLAVFTQLTHVTSVLNSSRSLKVGDTFTPAEMLPVAIKLMQKVEEPGLGKGIVSASRNAADLADRLFEAFFLTSKRFVTLQEFDISGLDAIQALALSGEVANSPYEESITEPTVEMYLKGQKIDVINEGRKCKYKLLSKRIDDSFNVKRRGIDLAKKLSKKRRLVVKSRRGFQPTNKVPLEKAAGKAKEPLCRWRYECSNPADLDSCHIQTQCVQNATMTSEDYIGAKEKDPEYKDTLHQFRKMVSLSIVDEEVEKILENRIAYLRPTKQDENDRVESLAEYFNKIIISQSAIESTTATFTNNYVPAQSNESNGSTEAVIESGNAQNSDCNENRKKVISKEINGKRQF